jgi:hypothetical protein
MLANRSGRYRAVFNTGMQIVTLGTPLIVHTAATQPRHM